MKLSREQVQHIALLARLGLSEQDVEKFSDQLSNILENFTILQEVDTTGTPPTAQSIDLQNIMRKDEVIPSYPREDVLRNAPHEEDGCFRTKAVLE
ncbi:MAG: Asp-tRNA(Asn)/Glu-tRNA(Gln) amidotransferase subunit GatC [Chloroflexi bacterium]|nr:Asp-tRNA(Asn)/Glu-tRNA(Gln) amidotransferase subunit GatC [Chloroflexota bacterium]